MPCGLPSWYFIIPPAELEPVDGSAPRAEPRVAFIMQCVARYFGISHAEIISERRMHRIVRPRQIAFYLCSQLTRKSLVFIGRQFGKDHSTVLHAVRKMTRRIHEDSDLANDIATLTHAITGKYQ